MSEQNKDIVRRAVDAFCRGDYPGIFAEAADDLTFTLMGQTGISGTIAGKTEVVAVFERALGEGLEAPSEHNGWHRSHSQRNPTRCRPCSRRRPGRPQPRATPLRSI